MYGERTAIRRVRLDVQLHDPDISVAGFREREVGWGPSRSVSDLLTRWAFAA
jgi:hypothetical protein